jgi:Flp pilus assembly protein TadD
LDIIDTKSGEERKTALKRLNNGSTYRYLLKNFYPQLRKACYLAVYYDELADVAAADINKANEMIRNNQPAEALEILSKHEADSRAWNSIGASMLLLERAEKAIYWLEKAIEAGSEEAKENIKYLK